jgi:hypothetical protein
MSTRAGVVGAVAVVPGFEAAGGVAIGGFCVAGAGCCAICVGGAAVGGEAVCDGAGAGLGVVVPVDPGVDVAPVEEEVVDGGSIVDPVG